MKNIRKYILVTLTHAEAEERKFYTSEFLVGKARGLFNCQAVVVAKELHASQGYHFHMGVLNDNASVKTATKRLREAFVEFEGRQFNVSFHKSWNTICTYLLKQDQKPHCWGITLDECRARAERQRKGKRNVDSMSALRACESWGEVLEHPKLGLQALRSYSSVKQVFMDLQEAKPLPPLAGRLKEFLAERQREGVEILPYRDSELGDRLEALNWLGDNLAKKRPLRSPQLLILGRPMTGKTRFVLALQEFLKTYELPARKDDFSGASVSVDLWVVDEFTSNRTSGALLNMVLDGQRVRLDCKYGHLFFKEKNIPILLLGNQLPSWQDELQDKAFATRVNITEFLSCNALEAERLALTLLERIEARGNKQLPSAIVALPVN